jgi:hypothetical protein
LRHWKKRLKKLVNCKHPGKAGYAGREFGDYVKTRLEARYAKLQAQKGVAEHAQDEQNKHTKKVLITEPEQEELPGGKFNQEKRKAAVKQKVVNALNKIENDITLSTQEKATAVQMMHNIEHSAIEVLNNVPSPELSVGTKFMKETGRISQAALTTYNDFANEYPRLARWGSDILNIAFQSVLAGPAGAVNGVRATISGEITSAIAGDKIAAVFATGVDQGAKLLMQEFPGLTYDEAAATVGLGMTLSIISAGGAGSYKMLSKQFNFKDWGSLQKLSSPGHNPTLPPVGPSKFILTDEIKHDIVSVLQRGSGVEISAALKKVDWDVPPSVFDKLPADLKIKDVAKSDNTIGIRFRDSVKAEHNVRIMKGNPDARHPSQRQDYVKITSNGRVLGRDGNVIDSKAGSSKAAHNPEAHIPLSEYQNWKEWNKK